MSKAKGEAKHMIRIEQDGLGARVLPSHAYYGIRTLRASEKIPHGAGMPIHGELMKALACVKKAAALAHLESGTLPARISGLIVKAAEEVIAGQHARDIVVDWLQDPTGESLNMNVNEIIANRALELMLEDKGNYSILDPVRHVNRGQSASGVIAMALRVASHRLTERLIRSVDQLIGALVAKKSEIGSRPMPEGHQEQPGTPAWFSRRLDEGARQLQSGMERMAAANARLAASLTTANAGMEDAAIASKTLSHLRNTAQIGESIGNGNGAAKRNNEAFTRLSSAVRHLALNLSNLCSDIRLAASLQNLADSPEWISGKEVAASEALGQIAFQAIGFDHSLGLAAEAGMLDPGAIPPVVAYNLLESLTMMDKGVEAFATAIQSHAGRSASCR